MAGHRPVLYHEIIHALEPHREGRYLDGTLGAGGHAYGILDVSSPSGQLLGLDLDPQALDLARSRLAPFGKRAILVKASYTSLLEQMAAIGWEAVDGIVLDLGLSSMQLDTPERGFSFQVDAPLDMRFDPDNPVTAADLVNNLPETELADILYRYGEETRSRQIARSIIQNRPIKTTFQLAEVISRAFGGGKTSATRRSRSGPHKAGIDPATLTFQALRIAVNHELESVETVLPKAVTALRAGGRLAIIAFHSLEDRLVKQFMRLESQDCICPPKQPVCTCGHHATIREITHRPVKPSEAEIQENSRARSARLRVAEKI